LQQNTTAAQGLVGEHPTPTPAKIPGAAQAAAEGTTAHEYVPPALGVQHAPQVIGQEDAVHRPPSVNVFAGGVHWAAVV
jgi:hypothetical protein